MSEQRIEFLEYLKKEFIEWWEDRKNRKRSKRELIHARNELRSQKRKLLSLKGTDLTVFLEDIRNYPDTFKPDMTLFEMYQASFKWWNWEGREEFYKKMEENKL